MPTLLYETTAGEGWVKVADTDQDFMIEARTGSAQITFQDSAPDENAPYHTLSEGEILVRVGTGNVYFRTIGWINENASVVVTT